MIALRIEPLIDSIAPGAHPIINAITSSIETLAYPIASGIESSIDSIAESIKEIFLSKCRNETSNRDRGKSDDN